MIATATELVLAIVALIAALIALQWWWEQTHRRPHVDQTRAGNRRALRELEQYEQRGRRSL